MRVILGGQYQPLLDGSSVTYTRSMSDPVPTATVAFRDATSSLFPQRLQELLILDDQVTPNPTVNLLLNPALNPYNSLWTTSAVPTGETISPAGGGGFTITFSNVPAPPNNSYPVKQLTWNGSVVPGQAYTLSFYAQATAPVNIQLDIVVSWFGAGGPGGPNLGSALTLVTNPSTTLTRYTLSGIAPANAACAYIQLGTGVTNATNSGSISFFQTQFEPNWIPALSYPTPWCGPNQTNCQQLPLGFWIRQYRKFAGLVNHVSYDNYVGNSRTVIVNCVGYAWLLSCIIANDTFSSQTDAQILTSLLNSYMTSNGTAIVNISNTVITGSTLTSLQLNWDDLRTVADNLASQSSFYWTIDYYWNAIYAPPGYFSMQIGLICDNSSTPDNVTTFPAYNFSAEDDYTQPGSTILVIGSGSNVAKVMDPSTVAQNGVNSGYFLPTGNSYMRKVNESSLNSVADCTTRGLAELLQYDYSRQIYHLTTNVELIPGESIQVTSNTDNLNQTTLLIQQVTATWLGTNETLTDMWEYKADLGAVNRAATHILSRLFRIANSNSSAPAISATTLAVVEHIGLFDVASAPISPPAATYWSAILADTPIAYYHLAEVLGSIADDSSGNSYAGTLHGGVTQGATALVTHPIDLDHAMTFNGSTGYVSLPTTFIPTAANHAWSLEAWCSISSFNGTNYQTLVAMGNRANGALAAISVDGVSHKWVLYTYDHSQLSAGTASTATTYHVVGTYDGTNVRLYVNGSLVAGPTALSLTLTANFASIGSDGAAVTDYFPGTLDEVAIYNYALSSTQISNHYTVGTAP